MKIKKLIKKREKIIIKNRYAREILLILLFYFMRRRDLISNFRTENPNLLNLIWEWMKIIGKKIGSDYLVKFIYL